MVRCGVGSCGVVCTTPHPYITSPQVERQKSQPKPSQAMSAREKAAAANKARREKAAAEKAKKSAGGKTEKPPTEVGLWVLGLGSRVW